MGNGSVMKPGDVQRMTAGTGVRHSEYNPSQSDPVHFLQIWILPARNGLTPGYEQTTFTDADKRGRLCLIGSRDGRDDSVTIHQDVDLFATLLEAGESVSHSLGANRLAWVQVARGAARIDGTDLAAGDGVAVEGPADLNLAGVDDAVILLFDMGRMNQ